MRPAVGGWLALRRWPPSSNREASALGEPEASVLAEPDALCAAGTNKNLFMALFAVELARRGGVVVAYPAIELVGEIIAADGFCRDESGVASMQKGAPSKLVDVVAEP